MRVSLESQKPNIIPSKTHLGRGRKRNFGIGISYGTHSDPTPTSDRHELTRIQIQHKQMMLYHFNLLHFRHTCYSILTYVSEF